MSPGRPQKASSVGLTFSTGFQIQVPFFPGSELQISPPPRLPDPSPAWLSGETLLKASEGPALAAAAASSSFLPFSLSFLPSFQSGEVRSGRFAGTCSVGGSRLGAPVVMTSRQEEMWSLAASRLLLGSRDLPAATCSASWTGWAEAGSPGLPGPCNAPVASLSSLPRPLPSPPSSPPHSPILRPGGSAGLPGLRQQLRRLPPPRIPPRIHSPPRGLSAWGRRGSHAPRRGGRSPPGRPGYGEALQPPPPPGPSSHGRDAAGSCGSEAAGPSRPRAVERRRRRGRG